MVAALVHELLHALEQRLDHVRAQIGSGEAFTADSAQARLALLAPMPLLAHCTERELRVVAQATTPRRYAAGAVVFEEGDDGTELVAGALRRSLEGTPFAQLATCEHLAHAVSALFLGIELLSRLEGDGDRAAAGLFASLEDAADAVNPLLQVLAGSVRPGTSAPGAVG